MTGLGLLAGFRDALREGDPKEVRRTLNAIALNATFNLSYPFETTIGAENYYSASYAQLFDAMPDLECRDWIAIEGKDEDGAHWVGFAGHYLGTFENAFLDIPPTGHIAQMRFHEFYRFDGDSVIEMQAIWDLPELILQSNAWPMQPSLGIDGLVPTPMSQDGLGPHDASQTNPSRQHVIDMLIALQRHPKEPVEAMELERFWHPKMNWYGPAGIGSMRGIKGFRNWHQIPFLAAMPDRGQYPDDTIHHFFAEGCFVGVTGWPNMKQTISGAGWLGIPPADKTVTMRSLDFWRIEDGLIRENWVLVDLLDVYSQIGVDVLARMREFNKARIGFDPETGKALA